MNSLQRAIDPLSGPGPARNRRRNPLWRFRRVLFGLALLVTIGLGGVLYAFGQTELPEDRFDDIAQTSFLCTADVVEGCGPDNAAAMLSTAGEDREIITFDDLPESLIQAVVATEDQGFWEHQGVDPRGFARAAYQYARREGVVQGGSTITMQYVKLAFNDQDRTLARKARQAIRAVKFEQDLADECADRPDLGDLSPHECAKRDILTRYLNRAYFGRGASGVAAAARAYFGKDVGELTVAEAAFLAGLLRNPNGADPEAAPEEAVRRRTTSLELMMQAGYVDTETATAANVEPWALAPRRSREGLGEVAGAEWGSEHFVEEVRQQLDDIYPNGEIYTGGLRVYTTLDLELQRMAYETAHTPKPDEDLDARGLPELGPLYLDPSNPDDPAASIVSIDGDGRVVAMLGGANFEESEFNLATSSGTTGRQPGSTFKTFGLAEAIDQGISARSYFPALPGVAEIDECGPPGNPWRVTGGASARYRHRDLVDGLVWSSNIVYAELVAAIGPAQVRDLARDMGISTLPEGSDVPCALVLGSEGVPVIEMAAAYSVFERDGLRVDPILIDRIENAEGEVICRQPTKGPAGNYACLPEGQAQRTTTQVLEPTEARQVNYVLTRVVEEGTGKRAVFDPARAIAGKTGTSQHNRDGWFAGFSCDFTTVVWMGHDGPEELPMIDFRKPPPADGSPVPLDDEGFPVDDRNWANIEGGNFPAMFWADYMAKATADRPPCDQLNVDENLTGSLLNQDLSTTTLPPCGVELDQYGYPKGSGPEDFVVVTTAPPASTPPGSQPEGLPRQEDGSSTVQVPCVPLNEWAAQGSGGGPGAASSMVDESSTSTAATGDGSTTLPGGSTTLPGGSTVPGSSSAPTSAPPSSTATTAPAGPSTVSTTTTPTVTAAAAPGSGEQGGQPPSDG
ncbi:MAG: transglycosylase domain-containing protein [Acidimicrobiales bacterium]